eukprot:jgi/Astpho2/1053/Aster-x0463
MQVGGDEKFSKVVKYLQDNLKTEQVFVYLKEAFSPSLDEKISVLAFGNDNQLNVNYACMPAWG